MSDRFETRWYGIDTGGTPALMLANTLDWRLREHPVELLGGVDDLLTWAWSANALELAEAKRLRTWSAEHPRLAARALEQVRELREAAASIFQAKVADKPIADRALATLDQVYREAMAARTLRVDGATVRWTWQDSDPKPTEPSRRTPEIDRIRWAVAIDAVRLLTGPEGDRVRQCADAECGWFFLDESRNRSRRWCSMEACGNRNKVRRFYRRATSSPDHDS